METAGNSVVPTRFESIDCVRGIAALAVVLTHILLFMTGANTFYKRNAAGILYIDSNLDYFPIRILWSGHQAVILFFVISGFSLYLLLATIQKHQSNRYLSAFFVSRWGRLYPAYIASILLALFAYWLLQRFGHKPPQSHFSVPRAVFDWRNFLAHLVMIGQFDTSRYNGVIWSIIHEMRISMLFPFIYFWVQRRTAVTIFLWCLLYVAIIACVALSPSVEKYYLLTYANFLHTLKYAVFFVLGASIAKHRESIVRWMHTHSHNFTILYVSLGVYAYSYQRNGTWSPSMLMFSDLCVGIGSSGIVVFCLSYFHNKKCHWLPSWLGRISYSLYLTHLVCLSSVYLLLGRSLPFSILVIVMLTTSLAVATVMWRLVEVPSLKWSRDLRSRGRQRLSIANPA